MNEQVAFLWVNDSGYTNEIVHLFENNLEPDYISHSEILIGRSINPLEWDKDLHNILEKEIKSIFSNPESNQKIAAVFRNSSIEGFCIIQQIDTRKNKIWVIEDIIVDKLTRNHGTGTKFLNWLIAEAAARQINYMICESGIQNAGAHHFFVKNGFNPLSQSFIKQI